MRIRTIKPEFYLHEGLYELERETNLPIRLSFTGLWCVADREGRFKWEPRKIGIQILPYDGIDFSRVLDALTTRGFVRKYACDSVEYGWIPSFLKHQVINNREKASDFPDPLETNDFDASGTREARVDHAGKAEGKGREGKGTERERVRDALPENLTKTSADEYERVMKLTNGMNPRWRTAFTRAEMDELQNNARIFFDLTDDDWKLLKAYMHCRIPERLGKYWQPEYRGQFLKSISDIVSHADRWKKACEAARIKTGLEATP